MGALKHIRKQKMISQKGLCYYCGLPMWDDDVACQANTANGRKRAKTHPLRCTAEHLQARSEGGKDRPDNIVAACRFCNALRHRRKKPLAPHAYRQFVQRRMAAGKWLSALKKTSPRPT